MEYQGLSKKAKPVLLVTAAVQAILFSAILLFCIVFIGNPSSLQHEPIRLTAAIITVLLGIVWLVVSPMVRFRRYKYKIASDRIEIIEGIFFIRRTLVPIDRIHQIDIVRGPIDNRFGLAKVTVTTAGATATMRFLELEKAEQICETLNATVLQKIRNRRGEEHV